MDVFTLLVTVTVIGLLVAVVMVFLAYAHRDRAMARGATALIIIAAGLTALVVRSQIGAVPSILLGNVLIGAGFAMLTHAVVIYQERDFPALLLFVPVGILLPILVVFLDDLQTRTALASFIYFSQVVILLILTVSGRDRTPGMGWKILVVAFGIYAFVMGLRTVAIANDHNVFQELFAESWIQSLTYLVSLAGLILVALGFSAMSLEIGTRQLRAAERKFKTYIEQANDVVYTLNMNGEFEYLSPNVETWLGNPPEYFIGKHFSEIIHPEDLNRCTEFFNTVAEKRIPQAGLEYRVHHGDGSWRWHDSNATPILDDDGKFQFFLGIGRDIHQRKLDKERLDQLAYYDSLTNLPNRILIKDRFVKAATQAERNGKKVAVLFLDMNNFKDINDNFGHKTGDASLQEVTQRIQAVLRASDSLGRLGGDEFVVILSDVLDQTSVEETILRMKSSVSQTFEVNSCLVLLDCAIGFSIFPDQGREFDALLSLADSSMYRAKRIR